MPDPLDPTDAIVSAFTDMFKRTGLFLAVTAGAAFLGWNIHNAPNVFASLATLKLAALHLFTTWLAEPRRCQSHPAGRPSHPKWY